MQPSLTKTDATPYPKNDSKPAASPYFVGVEAALKRASAKAIAKARAAGLEPVVADNTEGKTENSLSVGELRDD